MNIFVTGATGFIGTHFMMKLLSRIREEDRIFSLVRKSSAFQDERVVELVGALEDIERFAKEMSECEYVFHLAANPVFSNKFNYDLENHAPTVKIVDILKKSPALKNFVFISSIGAVDRNWSDDCSRPLTQESVPAPTSLYGKSKWKSEQYIAANKIPFTVIRPAWVYGPGMRQRSHINEFVSLVLKGSPVARLDFPGKVSLIHVDDLSDALVRCLGHDKVVGNIYFAATQALPIGRIFKIISEKAYKKSAKLFPVFCPSFLLKKVHRVVPLAVNNLFLDYLWAQEEPFMKDFCMLSPKRFEDTVDDVIAANIHNGYWVVTGANSGIGYALARRLDGMGKRLVLIDKNTDQLGDFQKHIVLKADLGHWTGIDECVKAVPEGKIFCLVHNAGVGFKGDFEGLGLEKIEETIDVDVRYPVMFTKKLLGRLVKDESVIVNIASSVAYNPLPGMAVYAASKAFLASWSDALGYELKKSNKVITFVPSGTLTNFQKNAGVRVEAGGKGLLSAAAVADEIVKAVYRKKGTVVFGLGTRVLLGISKCLPRDLSVILWGRLFGRLR